MDMPLTGLTPPAPQQPVAPQPQQPQQPQVAQQPQQSNRVWTELAKIVFKDVNLPERGVDNAK